MKGGKVGKMKTREVEEIIEVGRMRRGEMGKERGNDDRGESSNEGKWKKGKYGKDVEAKQGGKWRK